jgi:hypothetical protein
MPPKIVKKRTTKQRQRQRQKQKQNVNVNVSIDQSKRTKTNRSSTIPKEKQQPQTIVLGGGSGGGGGPRQTFVFQTPLSQPTRETNVVTSPAPPKAVQKREDILEISEVPPEVPMISFAPVQEPVVMNPSKFPGMARTISENKKFDKAVESAGSSEVQADFRPVENDIFSGGNEVLPPIQEESETTSNVPSQSVEITFENFKNQDVSDIYEQENFPKSRGAMSKTLIKALRLRNIIDQLPTTNAQIVQRYLTDVKRFGKTASKEVENLSKLIVKIYAEPSDIRTTQKKLGEITDESELF